MNPEFSRQIFEKQSNTKFQVFPCGRTDRQTDRQTDMTKLTVDFHNFANAPTIDIQCEIPVEYIKYYLQATNAIIRNCNQYVFIQLPNPTRIIYSR
jgi:hypothetical protein